MADYYPLLAKAVSGLADSNATTRRAIYERARKALIGQLRAIQPPIADVDLARENGALDEAIARLEADIAAKNALEALDAALGENPSDFEMAQPVSEAVVSPSPATAPSPAASAPVTTKMKMPPRSATTFNGRSEEDGANDIDEPLDGIQSKNADKNADLRMPRQRESNRPAAPLPSGSQADNKRFWILGAVIAALVLLVAGLAIKLRDQPGDLSQLKSAAISDQPQTGKNTDRVGVVKNESKTANGAGVATGADPVQAAPPSGQQGPVPVAYRAALLTEAPEEKDGTKTYIGSVVWRLDNVPAGPGQPLGTAIHADIDIPEAKLRMTLDIRKNTDASLSASHIAEVRFNLLTGSEISGVKLIKQLMMRRDDKKIGDILAGEAVSITNNYYLVALSKGDVEIRNVDLMKSGNWIDLPISLTNGRVAKLTMEKGVSGERIFNDAFSVWAQK